MQYLKTLFHNSGINICKWYTFSLYKSVNFAIEKEDKPITHTIMKIQMVLALAAWVINSNNYYGTGND